VITFVWIKLDVAIGAGKKGKGSAVVTFEAGNEPRRLFTGSGESLMAPLVDQQQLLVVKQLGAGGNAFTALGYAGACAQA
jgi:hypothetical protein